MTARTLAELRDWERQKRLSTVQFVSQELFEQLPDWDVVMVHVGSLVYVLGDFQVVPIKGRMRLLWATALNGAPVVEHGNGRWLWDAAVVQRAGERVLELTVHASCVEPGTPTPIPGRKAADRVVWVDALPATEFERIGIGVGFEWAWCELSHSLCVRVRNGVIQTPELERSAAELCARLLLGEEPG